MIATEKINTSSVPARPAKNNYGQYFTPDLIARFMLELASVKPDGRILEPSCGKGVFLKALREKGYENVTAYEIDTTLDCEFSEEIIYRNFLSERFAEKFDLIIGNPPYIRWKNLEPELKAELAGNELWNQYFNSLCDYLYIFILKSIEILEENGELIFICPEYWLNTTHSISLRNYMVANGYFEAIYHFNETPIFDGVTVSIIIFKFIKSKKEQRSKVSIAKYYSSKKPTIELLADLKGKVPQADAEYFEIDQFQLNERWILAPDDIKRELKVFESNCSFSNGVSLNLFHTNMPYHTIGEICDIGNGLVSGLDRAFQLKGVELNEAEEAATIQVIKAKDLHPYTHGEATKYVFIDKALTESEFESTYPNFSKHLLPYRPELELRYKYNREIHYWEWVFLRNLELFRRDEKRIFVPCKERISNKDHFRFSLVESNIFPTQDVTAIFIKPSVKVSIYYVLAMLNNHRTFNWLKHNGIVKGNIVEFSEKPITSIPIRMINWNNPLEIELHLKISESCKSYIKKPSPHALSQMELLIDKLF